MIETKIKDILVVLNLSSIKEMVIIVLELRIYSCDVIYTITKKGQVRVTLLGINCKSPSEFLFLFLFFISIVTRGEGGFKLWRHG